MKVQSDHIPESLVKSRGKTQVNYNIKTITVEDIDNEPRTAYEYDMVEVEGKVTKAKVLAAMNAEELEDDSIDFDIEGVALQYKEAKNAIDLSDVSKMTYAQLDTYVNENIKDMASARAYLKKLSKIVLALVKRSTQP
jgi:hypothetical protein